MAHLMFFQKSHCVLLQFDALEWQLEEVVVAFDVGCVVHEEDEQVGGDVNDFISGDLEPQVLVVGDVGYFDDFFALLGFRLWYTLFSVFDQTYCSHLIKSNPIITSLVRKLQ